MDITQQHKDLVKCVQKALGEWRKFTIAIDGFDGSGKSTLARFLSWQTEISVIETDMILDSEREGFTYRLDDFKRLIETRHSLNRPVIIEGVLLLRLLEETNLEPDYLIYVEKKDYEGSITLSRDFVEYQAKYRPKDRAHFIFHWSEE
jgi:uridine kinase